MVLGMFRSLSAVLVPSTAKIGDRSARWSQPLPAEFMLSWGSQRFAHLYIQIPGRHNGLCEILSKQDPKLFAPPVDCHSGGTFCRAQLICYCAIRNLGRSCRPPRGPRRSKARGQPIEFASDLSLRASAGPRVWHVLAKSCALQFHR